MSRGGEIYSADYVLASMWLDKQGTRVPPTWKCTASRFSPLPSQVLNYTTPYAFHQYKNLHFNVGVYRFVCSPADEVPASTLCADRWTSDVTHLSQKNVVERTTVPVAALKVVRTQRCEHWQICKYSVKIWIASYPRGVGLLIKVCTDIFLSSQQASRHTRGRNFLGLSVRPVYGRH